MALSLRKSKHSDERLRVVDAAGWRLFGTAEVMLITVKSESERVVKYQPVRLRDELVVPREKLRGSRYEQ